MPAFVLSSSLLQRLQENPNLMKTSALTHQLEALKQQHAYRQRRTLESPQGVEIKIDGKSFISFCSNDYLGLANHPKVCTAACQAINEFGVGSGASQLVTGYSQVHERLEQALAEFLNYPRVVLFSSGYLANLGVVDALSTRETLVAEDRLNHASLLDAARFAGARLRRYRHGDIDHLADLLNAAVQTHKLIATDGVFSMEGTECNLSELHALKLKHNALLIVDDAHGIGVIGTQGKGTLEQQNIPSNHVDVLIGTFGKAFGSSGAFVACNQEIAEYLLQKSRTLIYTTAPAMALAAAAHASLDIIQQEPERRQRLHDNIEYFKKALSASSLALLDSRTPIQSIIIGDNKDTIRMSEQLTAQGILVVAIRPPTVPLNSARLRITLCSEHTFDHIDRLVSCLNKAKLV